MIEITSDHIAEFIAARKGGLRADFSYRLNRAFGGDLEITDDVLGRLYEAIDLRGDGGVRCWLDVAANGWGNDEDDPSIAAGLADVEAGRLRSFEEVFGEPYEVQRDGADVLVEMIRENGFDPKTFGLRSFLDLDVEEED